jgi:CBS domain-containing protein
MEITGIIKEDFIVIDDESSLSEMIGKLKNLEKRSGLVFRHDKYLGLIEKKKILRSKLDTTEAKVKNFVQHTPILNEHADIYETATLMHQTNLDFLPVESDKAIIGVIDAVDLIKLAIEDFGKLKISDIKLVKSTKLRKGDPVSSAIEIMHEQNIDQVPIFDMGKLYGIISYKDLLRKYLNWSPKRDVSAKFNTITGSKAAETDMPHLNMLPVHTFSTNDNLISVNENDSLLKAVDLMIENRVGDVVVMKGNDFQGLLTVKAILKQISNTNTSKNFNIKYVGLQEIELEPYEIYSVKKICSNEAFKLQRKLNNEFDMTVHFKVYKKEGTNHKYSVHLNIDYPGQVLTSSQEDWRIETAVRKTFNNTKNTVKSRFKELNEIYE